MSNVRDGRQVICLYLGLSGCDLHGFRPDLDALMYHVVLHLCLNFSHTIPSSSRHIPCEILLTSPSSIMHRVQLLSYWDSIHARVADGHTSAG